jgi:two-component sensor histidine kinase
MQIMPKTGAFEAIVLGLSEQSQRHQAAIAQFADRALTEPDLDPLFVEACQLCTQVLEVPAARVLECLDESALAQRCVVRRDDNAPVQPLSHHRVLSPPGSSSIPAGLGMMPGTLPPRMMSTVSALIDDGRERFGLLELDRAYARDFSELEADFISAIARLLGRAIARSRELEAMRQANEMLALQLDEAQTLLHALSHRARNDLLALKDLADQGRGDPQPAATPDLSTTNAVSGQALARISRRADAMADLCQHFLTEPDRDWVAFDEHLHKVCQHARTAYDLDSRSITLCVETEDMRLPLKQAVAFGIATNELMANAALHAFTQATAGCHEIRVQLTTTGRFRELGRLVIADTGTGLRTDTAHRDGLTLVRRLIAQNGGQISCDATHGTAWTVTFQRI